MRTSVRFLLFRDGRYYARKVVPQHLRMELGATEKRIPLGSDRRTAIARLPAALVAIDAAIDHGWRTLQSRGEVLATQKRALASPMDAAQLARTHYAERLVFDEEARDSGPLFASVGIDDRYVDELRSVLAGKLSDDEIESVLGDTLARFQKRGNLVATRHSPEWRRAARAIADAELHALERSLERDEGVFPEEQEHPSHLAPMVIESAEPEFLPPVSLRGLLEDHIQHLESSGRGSAARKAWPRIFEDLLAFLKRHRTLKGSDTRKADDARLLVPEEIIAWRDEALARLSPKTVRDVWIASLKAVLQHAVEDRKLASNPTKDVKVRHVPKIRVRDPGYSDDEALRVLEACLAYSPPSPSNPALMESAHVTAAKRWGPWLCAFTGARIGEVLQLRKSDVRIEAGITVVRITPEAGTVKNRSFRDVPLHQQLIDLGFLDFVEGCEDGPLFFSKKADPAKLPARAVAGRLSTWLGKAGLSPPGVAPNHAWRHRFKSQAIELSISPRIYDAIQGHVGRSASDAYGSVSLKAKKDAIDKLPRYDVR